MMRVNTRYLGLSLAMILLTKAIPAHAVVIDVSGVSFTSFARNPIAPGQRPTSFGYAFHYDKESNAAVTAGFSYQITLSPNATFGDADDVSLGLLSEPGSVGGISGDRSGTRTNPNGLSSFRVPAMTLPGAYNAFLFVAPLSPHVDPDIGDAFGQLIGTVTVKPNLSGDYNGDNIVDAADYTVWRDRLGSNFDLSGNGDETGGSAGVVDQADYAFWKSHFGEAAGSGSRSNGSVPEPATTASLAMGGIAAAVCFVRLRRARIKR